MAVPIKLNFTTKEDYAARPSVPANKKESATEYNAMAGAIRANYDRLVLYWSTDIIANTNLSVGQYVHYIDNSIYRIITGYNVSSPITWIPENAEIVTAAASNSVLSGDYVDIAALLADQANQELGAWYLVEDASADPTVDADWAIYQKLAASTADLSDYFKIAEKESLDLVVTNASETAKGIVEEATDAEMAAGTATGATGAKLFVNPAKLATFITAFLGAVHTWVLKQTFTSAPRFSSANASEFLKTDGSKDLISVGPATSADFVTGTDNTKPLTTAALKGVRNLDLTAVAVSASTMTLTFAAEEAERNFDAIAGGAISSAFAIAFGGTTTNLKVFRITIPITGTVAITMPSSVISERNDTRWDNSGKIMTLTAVGTGDLFELSFTRTSTGKFQLRAGYAQAAT